MSRWVKSGWTSEEHEIAKTFVTNYFSLNARNGIDQRKSV
jgi:hypothetical protein